ncbi:MAG TPA: hypothetical protein VFQ60_02485 [Patescibacteria group bacterium]|nr:hypothetical protein [Patescibacteria group bacterium]
MPIRIPLPMVGKRLFADGTGPKGTHRFNHISYADRANKKHWIEVEEIKPGLYEIVGNSLTRPREWDERDTDLGLSQWDDEVRNLDTESESFDCYGISAHLAWDEVEIFFPRGSGNLNTPWQIKAPSVERIRQALNHIAFCVWHYQDI